VVATIKKADATGFVSSVQSIVWNSTDLGSDVGVKRVNPLTLSLYT